MAPRLRIRLLRHPQVERVLPRWQLGAFPHHGAAALRGVQADERRLVAVDPALGHSLLLVLEAEEPSVGRLLVLDWAPHPAEGDKLPFIFNGGKMTADRYAGIQLAPDELDEAAFHSVERLPEPPHSRWRRRTATFRRASLSNSAVPPRTGDVSNDSCNTPRSIIDSGH